MDEEVVTQCEELDRESILELPGFMAQVDQHEADATAFARRIACFWEGLPSDMPEAVKTTLTVNWQVFSHMQFYEGDDIIIDDASDEDGSGGYV